MKKNKKGKKRSKDQETLFDYVYERYWSVYSNNTAIISSTCRQLALGIGGSILAIDKQSLGNSQVSCEMKAILISLVLFFVFDVAQYLYQSISYRDLANDYDQKIETKEIKEKSELVVNSKTAPTTIIFYTIKLVLLALASLFFTILILKN